MMQRQTFTPPTLEWHPRPGDREVLYPTRAERLEQRPRTKEEQP